MRREVIIAIIAGVVVLAILGVFIIVFSERKAQERVPSGALSTSLPAKAPPEPMVFSVEGDAGKIAQAVERPARPGNVQVAIEPRDGGRWVCVLAAGNGRYYDLDQGLTLDQFPALRDGGFQPVPPQMVRGTTSIYRSIARTAMGYDAARGDRILILLCPRDEWPQLSLTWPAAVTGPKPATSD